MPNSGNKQTRSSPPQPVSTVSAAGPAAAAPAALGTPAFFPAFDRWGNLPVGEFDGMKAQCLMHAPLVEIKARFVQPFNTSTTRQGIWDSWMAHRQQMQPLGLSYATMIDGSFCTSKRDPNDLDVCLWFDANSYGSLTPAQERDLLRLLDQQACMRDFRLHMHIAKLYPVTHPRFIDTARDFAYWSRVFGFDRAGHPKSLLLVTDTGVLP